MFSLTVHAQWSNPANNPPVCNASNPGCNKPINESVTLQTKTGSFQADNLSAVLRLRGRTIGINNFDGEEIDLGGTGFPVIELRDRDGDGRKPFLGFDLTQGASSQLYEVIIESDYRTGGSFNSGRLKFLHGMPVGNNDIAEMQIGIGTAEPNAALHIASANPAATPRRYNYLQITTGRFGLPPNTPPPADCNGAGKQVGRMILDPDGFLWICGAVGVPLDYNWYHKPTLEP